MLTIPLTTLTITKTADNTMTTTFDGKRINYVISCSHEIIYFSGKLFGPIVCGGGSVARLGLVETSDVTLAQCTCINLHINSGEVQGTCAHASTAALVSASVSKINRFF